ncbi:MAG: hypothetical protein IKU37_08120 [Candidatus Gastranaerophilales bacterium]|nr:hypothetical protein [Candidatus Gastranaerophilales bacterium]
MQNDFLQNGIWNPDYITNTKNNGIEFVYTDTNGKKVMQSAIDVPKESVLHKANADTKDKHQLDMIE